MSEIAILLPVLGRPERAHQVVDSIRSSSGEEHRILFLCSPRDRVEIEACRKTSADVQIVEWMPSRGDFARKTNRGLGLTSEPFVFCGADDLTFTEGWDIEALRVAHETGAGVIGTWDGANPTTMSGNHSTHSLVRRSYAEYPGGTLDATGAIYCELYDHQFVDNELIEIAKLRGKWAFAAGSRVIHHHPIFDRTVMMDATYRKALANGREDRRMFLERRKLWDTAHAQIV